MKRKRIASTLLVGASAVLVLALVSGPAAAKSSDGTRSFHGTVASVAENGRALTINRAGGSKVRFVVRASTTYEHISGLSELSKGTSVEVHAVRSDDRLVATRIEANPGGRGSDDSPDDDHGSGGHGSDDPPGDDHGGGGHGSDD